MITGLCFIAIGTFVSNKVQQKTQSINSEGKTVSCLPDSFSYQSLIQNNPEQVVGLINDYTPMSAKNGQFVNSEVIITKTETTTSKVACGYIFIQAGTETNGSLQSWENVYLNPNMFGGHIDPESAIVRNEGDAYSEYIYSLSEIKYWKTRNDRSVLSADWSYLLNVSPEISFEIGLNTEDTTGFIENISIAYKCWDPKTGYENNDCKLEVK